MKLTPDRVRRQNEPRGRGQQMTPPHACGFQSDPLHERFITVTIMIGRPAVEVIGNGLTNTAGFKTPSVVGRSVDTQPLFGDDIRASTIRGFAAIAEDFVI